MDFEALFFEAPGIQFLIDGEGRIAYANRAALAAFGSGISGVLGQDWLQTLGLSEGVALSLARNFERALREGASGQELIAIPRFRERVPYECFFTRFSRHVRVLLQELPAWKLLRESPVGIAILDRELRYQFVNDACASMNGIPLEAHFGGTLEQIVPRFAPKLRQAMEAAMNTGRPTTMMEVYSESICDARRSGCWMAVYFPLYSSGGALIGILGLVMDATASNEFQERLREVAHQLQTERDLFETVIRRLPVAVAIADGPTGELVWTNEAVKAALGAELSQLNREGGPLRSALGGEAVKDAILPIRRPDGSSLVTEQSSNPIFDEKGRIAAAVVTFSDVTERLQMERERHELLDQLEGLLLAIKDPILVYDRDGFPIRTNPAAIEVCGFNPLSVSRAEMSKWTVARDLDGNLLEVEGLPSSRALRGEVVTGQCVRIMDGQRRERFIQVSATPLCSKSGDIYGAAAVWHDVTEMKGVEFRLNEAVQARDEFVSIASHEMKTPLTALFLQLQLLRRDLVRTQKVGAEHELRAVLEKSSKMAEAAERQSRRLKELLDDLLDLAQIRLGKQTMSKVPTDIVKLAGDVVERFRPLPVPIALQASTPIVGNWDPARLDQVITNLVSNALKYGDGKPVSLQLEPDPSGALVRLKVADHGKGIPSELHLRIFERFERADTSKKISGLGLGLYIARQVVEAHGGRIWVESELGKGSVFIVELPR
ncbi:MAG: PAS domain-containing protein [Oligoflexia bacterium]|nr:PAS domain-containing protein [Oligoflexia bacterium]